MAEAERPIGADLVVQRLDHLLAVGEAIQRRVFDGDQHIGNGAVVEEIGRLGHTKFPGGVHAQAFKGQQHLRLRLRLKLEQAGRLAG